MKFRKKPVEIEARQYPGLPGVGYPRDEINSMDSFWKWLEPLAIAAGRWPVSFKGESLMIPTLEGDHEAKPGDWIIRGVQGEIYPCKPDIFAATYEEVSA